jgi:hypothetical protein
MHYAQDKHRPDDHGGVGPEKLSQPPGANQLSASMTSIDFLYQRL